MSEPGNATPAVREADTKTVRRAVSGAAMGNAIEWYDYGVYGYLATVIKQVFFPEASPAAGTILVFAGIAIPFILRPLGGIVLGPLGDRFGRRQVLALTILLMSGSTFCVGLIPSYTTIGIWAPILLLFFRLVQGFSTGGEYGGAATFIAEYAPDRKRGFWGSFLEFGTLGGTILGAVLATVVQLGFDEQTLQSWGWRIPFLVAGPLGLIGFWLRNKLEDTPCFQQAETEGKTTTSPFKEVLTNVWPQILQLIGFVVLLNVADYILLTYMPTYLTQVLGISDTESLLVLIGVMVVMMALIAPVGSLSDRVGRKPLLLAAAIGYLVLAVPAFLLMGMKAVFPVVVGLVIVGGLLLLMLGTIGSALPAMFPTRNRYGGFSIGYSTSTAAFGGTAPLIVSALIAGTGNDLIPAFYLMGAAVIAIVPILVMPETARVSLAHPTRIPGTDKFVPDRTPAMAGAAAADKGERAEH
ncbi:MFS transporter [Pseudonocardia sp. RS11V-5]|uniref:MFS transporter n=1 Tax=Pseudonocardia terrae TaxID=2905831 RepID=UPI001E3E499D|nr:MFS transporter [Pseudonocardia terrae]MCE3553310.1 MFS transporter [Pseudonocardia terrae]